jgi:hypothetical protein
MPRLFNSLNEQYIRNYVAKIITMKESYKILLPYFFIQQNTPLPPNPSSKGRIQIDKCEIQRCHQTGK